MAKSICYSNRTSTFSVINEETNEPLNFIYFLHYICIRSVILANMSSTKAYSLFNRDLKQKFCSHWETEGLRISTLLHDENKDFVRILVTKLLPEFKSFEQSMGIN